jgi:DNA polymerase (family 10)
MDNRHVSIMVIRPGGWSASAGLTRSTWRPLLPRPAYGCHLELNADPDRLDLNDINAHAAKAAGVKLAISTDAHSTAGFANMRFGIDQARRGWLEPADVINTFPLSQLRKLLKR